MMIDFDGPQIVVGGGLLLDPRLTPMVGEERQAAALAEAEEERVRLEEEVAQLAAEQDGERTFWAHHRGLEYRSPGEAVRDVLAGFSDAADREDKRIAREQRKLEAQILNGEVFVQAEEVRRVEDRAAARELAKAEQEFLAQPASLGDVNAAVGPIESKLSRLVKRRRRR